MFAVYCTGHHSRVLLFTEHIEELVNRPEGVELHWRCPCGARGVTTMARELEAA